MTEKNNTMGRNNRGDRGGFGGNREGGSRYEGQGFKRGGFGGGDRGNGSGPRFGGQEREVTMYDATCADCHKPCQVPFRPANGRPVFCKDCFMSNDAPAKPKFNDAPRNDFARTLRPEPSFKPQTDTAVSSVKGNDEIKKQLEAVNTKLATLIGLIEKMNKPAPAVSAEPIKVVAKPSVPEVKEKAKKPTVSKIKKAK